MIVTCVTVYVKPKNIDDFIEASKKNHEGSIKEPANLRFDVLQSKDDPSRFLLYEAYEDEAGAGAHKDTEHYLTWRKTVEPWMEKPREGVPYIGIAP
uniref:Autoinducer 2-degrading protein n=1 Tax=Candidatus Kentrum sp. FW TaxID=2126338 RepID=A0A450SSH4_9GAMM|nr:MAG: autoinducer 2-degrading protein [Candidatus Kentron sp. FW]VFJ57027.1 MAG: autoinducer 2-degrading protein [Candidatus Kentron sp. FW]